MRLANITYKALRYHVDQSSHAVRGAPPNRLVCSAGRLQSGAEKRTPLWVATATARVMKCNSRNVKWWQHARLATCGSNTFCSKWNVRGLDQVAALLEEAVVRESLPPSARSRNELKRLAKERGPVASKPCLFYTPSR